MASIFVAQSPGIDRDHRFFVGAAIVMALVVVSGFSMQLALGRSSFAVPLFLHIHAFIFFGWTMLYLVQNLLVGIGSVALHRRIGWIAVAWIPAMMVMGTYVTVQAARMHHIPFFFQPAYFVVMDPLTLYVFAGLAAAAIAMRRQTLWHRRLMFCGMSIILGPGIGRILPMPLFIPYAGEAVFAITALFPLAGMAHDVSTRGRVHPAWYWGLGTIVAMQIAINAITFSPLGPAIFHAITAGSPGAAVAPLDFPPPPWAAPKAEH